MTEPEILFALAQGQNAFFVELAEALVDELADLGVRARISVDELPAPTWKTVYVLVPPHEFTTLTGFDPQEYEPFLARTVVICAEQPTSAWFAQNLELVRRAGAAFDINPSAVDALRTTRADVSVLELGYTRRWDRIAPETHGDPDAGRELDALFLGSLTERRSRVLANCADVLWRRQTHLVISDNSQPNEASVANFFAGDQKLELLRSARVLLNIHRDDEPYLEWLRAVEAFHCGAVFLSETVADYMPLVPGETFLVSSTASLPDVLEAALDDPDLLARIRANAYELLRSRPLRLAAAELRDAAARLLDQPVPKRLPSLARVWKTDDPQPAPLSDSQDASAQRQALKELRLDMFDLRRGLARQVVGMERAWETTAACASPAWLTAHPRVTVITALYNHAESVGDALRSLVTAEPGSFEVVVVDDGSTDASADMVRQFIYDHPQLPAILLQHAVNRGLGAARNTAWRAARGDLIFVLDADNAVRPTALASLELALRADPGADAAYGMIEQFDDAGPKGLISCLPWNPPKLRSGNYIDAMAMIRRCALEDLDGYTTDRRLFGWEDYDVWCGLADRDRRAVLVPNVVARYRSSPTSMLALSNLSHQAAFAALSERHPSLMDGVRAPA
jgi:hypothetical protein